MEDDFELKRLLIRGVHRIRFSRTKSELLFICSNLIRPETDYIILFGYRFGLLKEIDKNRKSVIRLTDARLYC